MCLSEMYISNPIFCTMVCIRSCIKKKVIGGKPFSVLVILKHIWNFWGILEYFFIHSFVANIHVAELIQHPNFRYLKKLKKRHWTGQHPYKSRMQVKEESVRLN